MDLGYLFWAHCTLSLTVNLLLGLHKDQRQDRDYYHHSFVQCLIVISYLSAGKYAYFSETALLVSCNYSPYVLQFCFHQLK